jgi:hypothetical protein
MRYKIAKWINNIEVSDYGINCEEDVKLITKGYKKHFFDFDTNTFIYSRKGSNIYYIAEIV